MFINFAELYASGGTFDRQEVNTSSKDGTTTIYGGYSPIADPDDPNIEDAVWLIRKRAKAKWSERSNQATIYQYGKP